MSHGKSWRGWPRVGPSRWFTALRRRFADTAANVDNGLSLDPRLLRAARYPLVRRLARRRAAAVFDLCAGFIYTQMLAACVELDLFALLRTGPHSAAEIAQKLGLPDEAAGRLLQAATALRLLRAGWDGRYGLGPFGTAVVADPGIAAMVAHHRLLYADLADPVAFLKADGAGSELARFWRYDAAGPEQTRDYTALMAASQAMVARQVLAAFDFRPYRRLLDVGGGNGTFLRHVASHYPGLSLAMFDLPSVADQARAALTTAGIEADVHGGDVRCDPLPSGADLVSLIRILHDHDDSTALQFLQAARRAIAPGGTLIVGEPMADVPGAERVGNAYFPIYLLAMSRGRTRTFAEMRRLLVEAGFEAVALRPTPLPMITNLVTARAAQQVSK